MEILVRDSVRLTRFQTISFVRNRETLAVTGDHCHSQKGRLGEQVRRYVLQVCCILS